jgi:hypothetical protein
VGFRLTNTGTGAVIPNVHPRRRDSAFGSDLYRLSATVEGEGWSADLVNGFVAVPFGGAVDVPVYVRRTNSAARTARVTLKAVSESDPSKSATSSYTVSR